VFVKKWRKQKNGKTLRKTGRIRRNKIIAYLFFACQFFFVFLHRKINVLPLSTVNSMNHCICSCLMALFLMIPNLHAQRMIEVDTRHLGAPIQPTMWGIFFEDINFGADGGLLTSAVLTFRQIAISQSTHKQGVFDFLKGDFG